MVDPLVKQFLDALSTVRKHLVAGDISLARKRYLSLNQVYETINNSGLAQYHKEIAYEQITKVHSEIEGFHSESSRAVPIVILAGVVLLAVGILILVEPSIVGLSFFEESLGEELGLTFEQSMDYTVILEHVPTSLRLSGKLTSGTARVYAQTDSGNVLIFDSNVVKLAEGEFADVCLDSCDIELNGRTLTLVVELSGGKLFLSGVSYNTDADINEAPVWQGTREQFNLDKSLELDLKNYFFDADGDDMVYLATSADNIGVMISGSIVKFTRNGGSGPREVTLIASDLMDITRKKITLLLS